MSNFTKPIPPLTPEQIAEIEELSKMTDDDIDFSDIPRLTKEELKKFKPARLRKKNLKIAG
ncbi:MAG: hypothetical protein IK062_06240 [Selenomonadaceae bacterium]|nr:hypothetical protein [Selenomonadaceae bacterium]